MRAFIVDIDCHQLGAVLVNDVTACAPGEPGRCLDGLGLFAGQDGAALQVGRVSVSLRKEPQTVRCITALAGFLAAREAPHFRPATGDSRLAGGNRVLPDLARSGDTFIRYCLLASLIATTPFIYGGSASCRRPSSSLSAIMDHALALHFAPACRGRKQDRQADGLA